MFLSIRDFTHEDDHVDVQRCQENEVNERENIFTRVSLNEILTAYKSIDEYDYVQWILIVFCFSLLSVFYSIVFRISIAFSLTR